MDMQTTLNYLFSLHTRGIQLGLERVSAFLGELKNPQKHFTCIHIAGTNGKGTVCQLVYSVLKANGRSVGLYTSPHIQRFNERIVVNGAEITDQAICEFVDKYRALFDKYRLTFFEITTALAFCHFKDKKVEYAVLETGMGGKLDATNVVVPAVTAITDISMDHEQFLGKTLQEIAAEKAGIIKKGVPLVFGVSEAEARQVILDKAAKITDYRNALEAYEFKVEKESAQDLLFTVKTDKYSLDSLYLPLSGRHQICNALIALGVLEQLNLELTEDQIREGFKAAVLKGRLEFHRGQPDILLDVAHNPKKMSALAEYLARFFPKKKTFIVFGVMADKDYAQMVKVLQREKVEFVFTRPKVDRALDPQKLLELAGNGKVVPEVTEAVKIAKEMAGKRGLVVVTGSFYTVSEAMAAI
jgi:dihydrofolate synthase / folylpolyglutamate synthase